MASTLSQADAFPRFRDADVEVVISPTRRYELHVGVLRRSSTLFADLLRRDGPKLSKKALDRGVTIRYRLVLEAISGGFRFRCVELDQHGKTIDNSHVGCWNENGKISPPQFDHYHMLLSALYNLDLGVDRTSVGSVMRDTLGILQVAEEIGSVSALPHCNSDFSRDN